MSHQALFRGLVYDERGYLLSTRQIGDDAFYVVDDDGFLRHVEARGVDRQILATFLAQLEDNKDLAIEQSLRMLGQDDIFTKAALESQLENLDLDQLLKQGVPEQARNFLGMLGFRVTIDVHGEVVRIDQPSAPFDE